MCKRLWPKTLDDYLIEVKKSLLQSLSMHLQAIFTRSLSFLSLSLTLICLPFHGRRQWPHHRNLIRIDRNVWKIYKEGRKLHKIIILPKFRTQTLNRRRCWYLDNQNGRLKNYSHAIKSAWHCQLERWVALFFILFAFTNLKQFLSNSFWLNR